MALQGFLANALQGIKQNTSTATAPTAPVPPAPQPSFMQKMVNGVKSVVSSKTINSVGNSVINQVKQGGQSIAQGINEGDPLNPGASVGGLIKGGQDIIQGIGQGGTAIAAPLAQIIAKVVAGNPDQPNIISTLSNDPNFQKFASSAAGRVLARTAGIVGGVANDLGTAAGAEGAVEDLNAPKTIIPKENSVSNPIVASEDAQKIASDSIKNPLSVGEQQSALRSGRLNDNSIQSVTNPNPAVTYEPDAQTTKMTEALQPIAEGGKLKAPTNLENQANNIGAVGDEISKQSNSLRTALNSSDAIWNENELKGQLNKVDVPDPVKNEPTLNKNVQSLKNATVKLAQDVSKKPVGLLDLRQSFDNYVQENYGKNFFDKGRNASPFSAYVYSLRDSLNDFASSKLPDGKLPDGTSYRDALQNQHQLINAQDEMVAKATREYPEGSKPSSRFMQAHPLIRRALTREGLGVALGVAGGTALTAASKKVLPYIESKL